MLSENSTLLTSADHITMGIQSHLLSKISERFRQLFEPSAQLLETEHKFS
jgi:hypothetical protein